jgi:hypothetical protein
MDLWNLPADEDPPRRLQGSLLDCSHTPVLESALQVGVYGEAGSMEAGSGREDSSHNILTLDALQVLSRSQVTPEVSMRIRPICKSLHTYIHT